MPNRKKKPAGKTPRLTAEQQARLREKARQELARLEALDADPEAKQMVEDFKTRFSTCEIVYKVILADYSQKKDGKKPERMQVNMTQAPVALSYAGYTFDKALLTRLFGAEDHTGKRSVKKLRDVLTHSMNSRAVEELARRRADLYRDMDAFLAAIRACDPVVQPVDAPPEDCA